MPEKNLTQQYYEQNCDAYIEQTAYTDLSAQYVLFEKYITPPARILDVGFGSGRDMLYFASKGYDVVGIDVVPQFVEHAQKVGLNAICGDFQEMQYCAEFDAVWACASLLHSNNLSLAFKKIYEAVKPNGIAYISMKIGTGTEIVGGRFYQYVDEPTLRQLAQDANLQVLELTTTKDKLNRTNQWLNAILKK